jgi:hypothetical protein
VIQRSQHWGCFKLFSIKNKTAFCICSLNYGKKTVYFYEVKIILLVVSVQFTRPHRKKNFLQEIIINAEVNHDFFRHYARPRAVLVIKMLREWVYNIFIVLIAHLFVF